MSKHIRIDAKHISSEYLKLSQYAEFVVAHSFCSVHQNIYYNISGERD